MEHLLSACSRLQNTDDVTPGATGHPVCSEESMWLALATTDTDEYYLVSLTFY